MILRYGLIILVLHLPLITYTQSSKWTYFSGNKAINSIAIKGNNVWMGSALGPILLNKLTGQYKHFYTCNCNVPSNYMIDTEIDDNGNIWFATITGLVKFDGVEWTAYNIDNYTYADYVNCFTIDPDGNKWIGTKRGGIGKFDGNSWEFFYLPDIPFPYLTDPPTYYAIYDIEFDKNEDKWISTNHGIYLMQGTSFSQNILTTNSGLPDEFIHDIEIDNLGNKWIASNAGLAFYNNSDWQVYNKSNSGLPGDTVNCISIDLTNKLWIGTNRGVVHFNGQSWSGNFNTYGVPDNVYEIFNDENQLNWFATDRGLTEFNSSTHFIRQYTFSSTNIGIGRINAITFNEGNDVWIGGDDGLTKFNGSQWFVYTDQLPDHHVTSIAVEKNDLWFGTHGGILKYSGGNWAIVNTINSILPSDVINEIATDGNQVYIGTDSGLMYTNGLETVVFNSLNSNLPSVNITKVAMNNSNIWLGTEDCHIIKFNKEDPLQCNIFDLYTVICSNVKGPPIPPCSPLAPKIILNRIALDTMNNILVATNYGLYKFDGNSWNLITPYADGTFEFHNASGILDFGFDQKGLLWLTSSKYPGLFYKNSAQYTSEMDSVITGMDQTPLIIKFDERNNLWIGTDQATIGVYNEKGVDLDITGTVIDFAGDSISIGHAYLYNTTNLIGGYDTVAQTDVLRGKYIFKNVADCGYTVFSEADISYSNLLPSYLGDTILWMGADTLNVQASVNAKTITLYEQPPPHSGKVTIIGDVESLLNTVGKGNGTKKRDPIDNAGVAITRKNKNAKGSDMANLVAYAKTDPDGRFEFLNFETQDIEVYDYYIFIDYPGIPMDTINKANKLPMTVPGDTLILHASVNPDIIHLTSNIITKVDDITDHSGNLKIFPNPLKVSATFEFPNDGHESYEFKLLNMGGIIVKTINNITENNFVLMREDLDTGFYIFELRGNKKYSGKLLVE